MRKTALMRAAAFAAIAAASLPLPANAQFDEALEETDADVIVVTAQKREQRAQDVAASLDVLTAAALENARLLDIADLASGIAGLDMAEFADGQYRLAYRGIGATGTSDNQNFSTAIDGVIAPYNNTYRLLDVERVEVLKGPQGTLYGRNTNAGVVSIVTRDGSEGDGGSVTVYGGSGETYGLRAALGGPLEESNLFFRLAGRYEQSEGFIENTVLGLDDAHATEDFTLRGTAGWDNGGWRIVGRLTYDRYDNNADNLVPVQTPRESIAPDLGTGYGQLVLPVVTIEGPLLGADFTSITAYASADRIARFSAVLSPVLLGQEDRFDSFSQEFRLAGDAPLFGHASSWVAGLYLLDERHAFRSTTLFTPLNLLLLDQSQRQSTRAIALFGEAETELSPDWTLTTGLRLAFEDQEADYRVAAGAPLQSHSDDYTSLQPKLVLAWRPQDDMQIYGSVTRGFRAGSIFISNPGDPGYDQEDVWQYELGLKGVFLDGALEIDAAAFYIDWTDMQIQRSVVLSTSPFQTGTVVDNASSARSAGFELGARYSPTDRLELFASASLTDAEYEDFRTFDTLGNPLDYSGNRIELIPETALTAGAVYTHPSGVFASIDATHYGEMAYDAANTDFQSEYTTLNATLAYDAEAFRIALSGRNLTDEEYFTRGLVVAGAGTFGYPADPRTVMLEITARFGSGTRPR